MILLQFVFWASVGIIAVAYFGYAGFMGLLAFLFPRPIAKGRDLTEMTLLVSVFNEERVIADKIRNALSARFPRELLEIVVVSDGSTDRTGEIVRQFASEGVRLLEISGRLGKSACLNVAVAQARAPIVVFSDANSMYEPDALEALAQAFNDPTVGFVTGHTRYVVDSSVGVSESVGFYSKLERWTKRNESMVGSCVGADGAIFAIRKNLFKTLETSAINDLVIPLEIVDQGARGVLEERAVCVEYTAGSGKGESARQIRITNRTLQALFRRTHLLNPARTGWFALQLLCHKWLKLITPAALVTAAVSSLVLATEHPLYAWIFGIQLTGYAMAAASPLLPSAGVIGRLCSMANTFVTVNVAFARGWLSYLRGERMNVWKSIR